MCKTSMIWIVALILGCFGLSAQTYSEPEKEIEEEEEFLLGVPAFSDFFSSSDQASSRIQSIESNSVVLRQIGDFNKATVVTSTEKSELILQQNGDRNRLSLLYDTRAVFADISQRGNENVLKDFVIDPEIDVTLELQQEGDGLYFERFGANNLTKSIRFNQTAASPVVIVRSFN